jgi:hypothetical protein
MMEKTRDDLHSKWEETRSASRSKMRGARSRQARDGWAGLPRQAGDGRTRESHYQSNKISCVRRVGDLKDAGGFFEFPER